MDGHDGWNSGHPFNEPPESWKELQRQKKAACVREDDREPQERWKFPDPLTQAQKDTVVGVVHRVLGLQVAEAVRRALYPTGDRG